MVKELIGAEVDVNHMEEVSVTSWHLPKSYTHYIQEGLSALMLCCEEGNSEMAELLLKSHADPNLQQLVCECVVYITQQ